jgi:hypothetical protein
MKFVVQKLIFLYACTGLMSNLGAMKQDWPPSSERIQQEMSKSYVKAGIQEMQQEVARELWNKPNGDRKELIRIYKQSTEFQAVIGQMQENLGLTDNLIIEHIKSMKEELGTINFDVSISQWMPIVNYAYPRLSQLILAYVHVFIDNDFDTLVRIVQTMPVKDPGSNIIRKKNELNQIDKRSSEIKKALGMEIELRAIFTPQDDIYSFLAIALRRDFANRLFLNYARGRNFGEGERKLYSELISAIKTSNFARKFCDPPLAQISTSLRGKLKNTFIVAMFRDASDRNGLALLFDQKNTNKSVELINDITEPDLRDKTKEFVREKAGLQKITLPAI